MSFFEISLDDAQERVTAKPGEYILEISGEPQVNEEKGFLQVFLKITGPTTESPEGAPYKVIRHPIFFPKEGDDKDRINDTLLSLKRFCTNFNIQWSRGDLASLAEAIKLAEGNSNWFVLKEKENEQYGASNTLGKCTGGTGH